MKVINASILIKVEKGATMKIGGLELPADAREYEIGHVYSVGEKVEGIKEGENLVYSKTGEPVIITEAGKDGKYFGELNLTFSKEEMNRSKKPMTHFIMMGLKNEGGFNEEDITLASVPFISIKTFAVFVTSMETC